MDNLSKEQRRKNMQHIWSKDTKIEIQLRKVLWHKGYRYRKNCKDILGKPDIVLTKYKITILGDGEFFYGKDWEVLKLRLEKSNNGEYWINKISRNQQRDDEVNKRLLFEGWTVIRFMKMFNLINIGERSGSGVPNIFNTWEDQGWKEPVIEERFDSDRTILSLEFVEKQAKKTSDIANYIGLSPSRTRVILSKIEDVEAIGENKNRKYRLKK